MGSRRKFLRSSLFTGAAVLVDRKMIGVADQFAKQQID